METEAKIETFVHERTGDRLQGREIQEGEVRERTDMVESVLGWIPCPVEFVGLELRNHYGTRWVRPTKINTPVTT